MPTLIPNCIIGITYVTGKNKTLPAISAAADALSLERDPVSLFAVRRFPQKAYKCERSVM